MEAGRRHQGDQPLEQLQWLVDDRDRSVRPGLAQPILDSAIRKLLEALSGEPRTMVFFESSHRVTATLEDMAGIFGAGRLAAVCRELTKKFETVLKARLGELLLKLKSDPDQTRGEFVIVVDGRAHDVDGALSAALELASELTEHLPASQAARVAAKLYNVPRRDVYKALGVQ